MPRHASTRRASRLPACGLALALTALLPGCASFNDFLGDTFTYDTNPNLPVGESENLRRVRGIDTETEPLSPEAGNVWPEGVQAMPTLQDLEREQNQASPAAPPPDLGPYLPDHRQPRPVPGSSSPDVLSGPGLAPLPNPAVQRPRAAPPGSPPSPDEGAILPGGGAGISSDAGGAGGYRTLTTPQGNSIIVPNGNGTSTVIKPDGSVQTIQTPGR
jgi:hypothetical protein